MDNYSTIANNFHNTVEAISLSVDELAGPIEAAGNLLTQSLLQDRTIYCCGNGIDGALAQILVTNLMAPHKNERPALPAITLSSDSASMSAITRSSGMEDVYARQVRALGQAGDSLVCINSSESTIDLVRAVQAAHERNMHVIALSNTQDREMLASTNEHDAALSINSIHGNQVVELLLMVIHGICSQIDSSLFGSYE